MRNFGIKQVGKDQIATVKNNTKPTFRQSEVQIELEITTVALHIGYTSPIELSRCSREKHVTARFM